MSFIIESCTMSELRDLCERYHPYKSAGRTNVYNFGVREDAVLVAAYSWLPPAPGVNASLSPSAPGAVLALSRMVAVPKDQRQLKHVSKPLKHQMNKNNVDGEGRIDRGRWPVLVTYSDESMGHNGYTYQCSGWTATQRKQSPYSTNDEGQRVSVYNNGSAANVTITGYRWIQRWEHRMCPLGEEAEWMQSNGWHRVEVTGKVWRSGKQQHTWIKS